MRGVCQAPAAGRGRSGAPSPSPAPGCRPRPCEHGWEGRGGTGSLVLGKAAGPRNRSGGRGERTGAAEPARGLLRSASESHTSGPLVRVAPPSRSSESRRQPRPVTGACPAQAEGGVGPGARRCVAAPRPVRRSTSADRLVSVAVGSCQRGPALSPSSLHPGPGHSPAAAAPTRARSLHGHECPWPAAGRPRCGRDPDSAAAGAVLAVG